MWVKICANTNAADALHAAQSGADAVGFVFAPSKRRVTPEAVANIVAVLPASVEKVGVFAIDDPHDDPHEVQRFVVRAGLTMVQLHTKYDEAFVRSLSEELGDGVRLIQTVAYELQPEDRAAGDAAFVSALTAATNDTRIYAVLVDAAKAGTSGGLGVAFDWQHVGELLRKASASDARVILAGGLKPENVAAAIQAFAPWGVDVASGVEVEPGKKDPLRVAAFIAGAEQKS